MNERQTTEYVQAVCNDLWNDVFNHFDSEVNPFFTAKESGKIAQAASDAVEEKLKDIMSRGI